MSPTCGTTPPRFATSELVVAAELRAAGCVFAGAEARLLQASAVDSDQLRAMVARRVAGEPLEHILGWAEFGGLRVALNAGVFVPRQRSMALVRAAARWTRPGALVVDLCCGSGALGLALASRAGPVQLHAADIDPVSVACARRNLAPIGGVTYCGDLFDPLPAELRGRVDVLLASVPYVPTDAMALMPREARDFESRATRDGGHDGLDLFRRVAAEARSWLAPGGRALLEVAAAQTAAARETVRRGGLRAAVITSAAGTVVVGARVARPRVPRPAAGAYSAGEASGRK